MRKPQERYRNNKTNKIETSRNDDGFDLSDAISNSYMFHHKAVHEIDSNSQKPKDNESFLSDELLPEVIQVLLQFVDILRRSQEAR